MTRVDLYAEFGLDSTATAAQIKKAYHKRALSVHPDKVSDSQKDTATEKFQKLSLYYAILSDANKRKRYDETGSIQEAQDVFEKDENVSWTDFFKQMFDSVTEKKIEEFKDNYKYGPEEIKDVLDSYILCKGDMFQIIEHVPVAELDDIERFQVIIQDAISKGNVQEFPKFRKVGKAQLEKKRKRAAKEAIEAQELKMELKEGRVCDNQGEDHDMDALRALIQAKQKDRQSNLIASLEEKYLDQEKERKKSNGKRGRK